MRIRASGVLLPLHSLPSPFGIGDMGPESFRFIDCLHAGGQHLWQILPVNSTVADHGHSPYHSPSAFARNPLLISPERLVEEGLLEARDLDPMPRFPDGAIDYELVAKSKNRLLQKAYSRFRPTSDFDVFCRREAFWLDDYALFTALGDHFESRHWVRWPNRIRDRKSTDIEDLHKTCSGEIAYIRFLQYVFDKQWRTLKAHANGQGIHIMGDMPIYVPFESADTWVNPKLFKLDENCAPTVVSGVPPDYFSETGQLWGHPVFDWDVHQTTGFKWWIRRIRQSLSMYDYLRIDHFRGLVAFWEIPAGEKNAINGRWVEAPVREFFDTLFRSMPQAPIIAEDLGHITPDVREVIETYKIPGMRVLVFGFTEHPGQNPNAPHNINSSCVVYTGTHDTNTAKGWYDEESGQSAKNHITAYFGRELRSKEFAHELVRMAQLSPAWLCIIPMQDLLAAGSESRINQPGSSRENWRWRVSNEAIESFPWKELHDRTVLFGRAGYSAIPL